MEEIADTPAPTAELTALHERFREVKHSVNNSLAVVMALAELAQRNPAHYEKLTKAVATRGPEIVQLLQGFQGEILARIDPAKAAAQAAAPTSAVFR